MFDRPKTQDELNAILDISRSYCVISRAYTVLGEKTKADACTLLRNAIQNLVKSWE